MNGERTAQGKGFVPVRGLHHFAYRCRDAEETRQFYEDVLGLPLAHLIQEDRVPSTGEYCPYVHIFFEMGTARSSRSSISATTSPAILRRILPRG